MTKKKYTSDEVLGMIESAKREAGLAATELYMPTINQQGEQIKLLEGDIRALKAMLGNMLKSKGIDTDTIQATLDKNRRILETKL